MFFKEQIDSSRDSNFQFKLMQLWVSPNDQHIGMPYLERAF